MKEIKKIKKTSLAKIFAFEYGAIAFLLSFVLSGFVLVQVLQKSYKEDYFLLCILNFLVACFFAIVMFLVLAIIGWIMGFVVAMIYNFFAHYYGGIYLQLEYKDFKQKEQKEQEEQKEQKEQEEQKDKE